MSPKNQKKWIFFFVIVLLLIGLGRFLGGFFVDQKQPEYKFVQIKRGDILKTISSSGPLSPVSKVQVGMKISGTVENIFVGYNDKVEEGQPLAELDTAILKADVADAEAKVARIKAELEEARSDYNRAQSLIKKGSISDSKFLNYKTRLATLKADLKAGLATVQRAKQLLEYAIIRSPISGIVIEKNVEKGQTLAANFATPTLFIIAEDLSQLEVLVLVDESDIGLIRNGQKMRFEVQAYPGRIWEGTVKKIRLQPQMIANVVNYTVVGTALNEDGLLLPGMTAETDFVIAEKKNVLMVSKVALRFVPTEDMIRGYRRKIRGTAKGFAEEDKERSSSDDESAQLWYIDNDGQLAMEQVKMGLSDGRFIEIVASRQLKEGMKVISGIVEPEKEKKDTKRVNRMLTGGPGGGPSPPR